VEGLVIEADRQEAGELAEEAARSPARPPKVFTAVRSMPATAA
jgi:hypothetical protein